MNQVQETAYHPERLLDCLIRQMRLSSDEELSRLLRVAPRVIRQIRAGTMPVGASMLLWMAEATGMSVTELRALMGDRRRTCRISCGVPRLRDKQAN